MAETTSLRTPPQEAMLMDLVQRLDRYKTGRVAAHIHLSKLSNAYNKRCYLRIASDSFTSLVRGFEGQLFELWNGDLFFIAKDVPPSTLQAAVDRIRVLFNQDPLLETSKIKGGPQFCSWYDLENEYEELTTSVQKLINESEAQRNYVAAITAATNSVESIKPDVLSKLEQSLETVDVTNIARRQTICTIIENLIPQPLFEEIYVSITDLQNVIAPDINISANTWLFRYLTQALDHRVMMMLIRDGVNSARPFSINLNVETILTPEFSKFEDIIAPQLRGRLVIEFNVLDIFSDMGAFMFARDYLHDRGFRLCLDGLTHHTMPYYNRAQLGFDLIKLHWTPNSLDHMFPGSAPEIRNLVMESGQAHTILCRCDDENAINVGHELGIVMFQGRQVDRLLTQTKPLNRGRF